MCIGGERNSGASQPVMKTAQNHFPQREICRPGGQWALDSNSEKLEGLAPAVVCPS